MSCVHKCSCPAMTVIYSKDATCVVCYGPRSLFDREESLATPRSSASKNHYYLKRRRKRGRPRWQHRSLPDGPEQKGRTKKKGEISQRLFNQKEGEREREKYFTTRGEKGRLHVRRYSQLHSETCDGKIVSSYRLESMAY